MLDAKGFRNLYTIIATGALGDNQLDLRVDIVSRLSETCGEDFNNTEDFHAKCQRYLLNADIPEELLGERMRRGWSVKRMAAQIRLSTARYTELESGAKRMKTKELDKWRVFLSQWAGV